VNTRWLDSHNPIDTAHSGSHWAYSWTAAQSFIPTLNTFGTWIILIYSIKKTIINEYKGGYAI